MKKGSNPCKRQYYKNTSREESENIEKACHMTSAHHDFFFNICDNRVVSHCPLNILEFRIYLLLD